MVLPRRVGPPARRRQKNADKLALEAAPAAAAERASFKGSGKYRATGDLVDGVSSGKVNLAEIDDNELPTELRKKTIAEKRSILKELGRKRTQIQKQIRDLSAKRADFIAAEQKKQTQAGQQDTLDTAIIKALRTQAGRKQYSLSD